MIRFWNLQLKLLLHHDIDKEIVVFRHGFNADFGIVKIHAFGNVNVDHFLDFSIAIVFQFPFLALLFAQNPLIVSFRRQEFSNSHAGGG